MVDETLLCYQQSCETFILINDKLITIMLLVGQRQCICWCRVKPSRLTESPLGPWYSLKFWGSYKIVGVTTKR